MRSLRSRIRNTSREGVYELLLGLCLMVLISSAFPTFTWLGSIGYSLIALVLTQLVVLHAQRKTWRDHLHQMLGVAALVSQVIWTLTPVRLTSSGVPLVLSWSVLVAWSVVRLVESLANERKVNSSMLMGAAAGYLLIGLTAGLVMSAVETIQPNSFEPLDLPLQSLSGHSTVLETAPVFARINYFAFVCLTTVGFGDITPNLPLARMIAVCTSIAGPLYLAVVMGVLISRYTGDVEEQDAAAAERRQQGHIHAPGRFQNRLHKGAAPIGHHPVALHPLAALVGFGSGDHQHFVGPADTNHPPADQGERHDHHKHGGADRHHRTSGVAVGLTLSKKRQRLRCQAALHACGERLPFP